MKAVEFIKKIEENVKNAWKYLSKRKAIAVISVVFILIIIVGLVLFVKKVLPMFIAISILIVILNMERISEIISRLFDKPLTFENEEVCCVITDFMFHVVSNLGDVMSGFIGTPITVNDLHDGINYKGDYNGVKILKLRLMRTQKEIADGDVDYIRNILQGASDARVRDGYLEGSEWAVPNTKNVPIVKIGKLTVTPVYIYIDIILTNTMESVKAASASDEKPEVKGTDATDPLFKKEGSKNE